MIYDALRSLEMNKVLNGEVKLAKLREIIGQAIAESDAGLAVDYDFEKISKEIDQELS